MDTLQYTKINIALSITTIMNMFVVACRACRTSAQWTEDSGGCYSRAAYNIRVESILAFYTILFYYSAI